MKRRAFTLIELLVVISIIAILAAIIYPVFSRIKQSGLRTTCLSNLKQIGTAEAQYRGDWDGYYPPAAMPSPNAPYGITWCGPEREVMFLTWADLLAPYGAKECYYHKPGTNKITLDNCQGIRNMPIRYAPNAVVHMRNLKLAEDLSGLDFNVWSSAFWKTKTNGAGIPGTAGGWGMTLNEGELNSPAGVISAAEHSRGVALLPNHFIFRGTFHDTYDKGVIAGPEGMKEHGFTCSVLFCDGHVESFRFKAVGGPLGDPKKWNNSPNPDGGGWNRNGTGDTGDDVYHGDGGAGDAAYPNPKREYPGWIPVTDQLHVQVPGWPKPLYNRYYGMYGNGGDGAESIFDIDMTAGEYNTAERPDSKYDE